MDAGTIAMMLFVLGFIWGGFGLLLLRSMRIDRHRGE